MVAVEAQVEHGTVIKVRITGDFFLHPEDAIHDLEKALTGLPREIKENEVVEIIREVLRHATLIGATPEDIARIFKKALL